jgi:serine/threonine-protein kinase ULK2
VKFITNLTTNNSILIVMEYCNGGDLEQYLQENGKLSEEEATTFLKHLLNGFKGLHKVHAMHRDFKAANVLLHDGVCKISDLGFSKQLK